MGDFKTIAKTGKDFVTILYEKVSEDVENTIIELSLDGMKMKTYLCDNTDTSITIQPLAKGAYAYRISQVSTEKTYVSEGEFNISSGQGSISECRHIPFYEKLSDADLRNLVEFSCPDDLNGDKVKISWELEPELFECVHIGVRKRTQPGSLLFNECVAPSVKEYSIRIQELRGANIYFEFVLKNGQFFGMILNANVSVHTKDSYKLRWSNNYVKVDEEVKRVEVINTVPVTNSANRYY